MCREGAWDELAVGVTSGIAIRSGMLIKKSCRTDNDCLLYTAFLFKKIFLSQSELRLPLLQVVSSNKYFSVGVQSPTEINAPRGCAVILKRRCQLALTRITHQVSRAFDLNHPSTIFIGFVYSNCSFSAQGAQSIFFAYLTAHPKHPYKKQSNLLYFIHVPSFYRPAYSVLSRYQVRRLTPDTRIFLLR